jgi:hypothetical protein
MVFGIGLGATITIELLVGHPHRHRFHTACDEAAPESL